VKRSGFRSPSAVVLGLGLGLGLALGLAGSASAQGVATIAVDAGVPFTAEELRAALAVRTAAPPDVVVHAVSATAVVLETRGGGLRLELGAARGVEAARLVALQLVALGEAPVGPVGPPVPVAPVAIGWAFNVGAGVGIGVSSTDLTLSAVSGDAVWRQGRWLWGGGVSWLHGSTVGAFALLETMDLGLVRSQVGFVIGRVAVVGGPALIVFHNLSGDIGVAAGASVGAHVALVDTGSWRAYLGAEIDAALQDLDSPLAADGLPRTPRITASASLGVAWGHL
jgi:hypothetical protein